MSQSDFVTRGQALVASGQYQEAVKVCRLGLLGRPTTVEGRIVLGMALLALKRFDEVLAEMRVAIELDHNAVGAHALKADALLKKGDLRAAIEALHVARAIAPGDPRILQLLAEAEHGSKGASAAHPSASFIAGPTTEDPIDLQDASEAFTKPTELSAPNGHAASARRRYESIPSPAVLAVGDKSGTLELVTASDDMDAVDDLDFDDLAAPPSHHGPLPAAAPAKRGMAQSAKSPSAKRPSTFDLDSGDIEVDDGRRSKARREASSTTRGAANVDRAQVPAVDRTAPPFGGAAGRAQVPAVDRTAPPFGGAAGRAQVPAVDGTAPPFGGAAGRAQVPAVDGTAPPFGGAAGRGQVPAVDGTAPPFDGAAGRGQVPAVDGTALAVARSKPRTAPPPSRTNNPPVEGESTSAALAMDGRTIRAPHGPPMPVPPSMPQARAPIAAPSPQMHPIQMAATMPPPALPSAAPHYDMHAMPAPRGTDPHPHAPPQSSPGRGYPPGAMQEPRAMPPDVRVSAAAMPMPMRMDGTSSPWSATKRRSKLSIALWSIVGAAVIGGGVFAGFQIRGARLQKQIAAARQHATDLAKSDTWSGWSSAEASLAGIVQASGTVGNRAALARAKALIAYEFVVGVEDAKATIDGLAGEGGVDGEIATAYLELARGDANAAKAAADVALRDAPTDPSSSYVAGQAALLAGDPQTAMKLAKDAVDKDPRPFFALGLARAQVAGYAWDEAFATVDRAFAGNAVQPAALIARAFLLADAGRLGAGVPLTMEVRAQLDKLAAEAKQPASAVSQTQGAFADLALARVDFARGEAAAARADIVAAASVGTDDQRFAEAAVETLFETGDTKIGEKEARVALDKFPTSQRARIELARILLAQGLTRDALDALAKQPTGAQLGPLGVAIRGQVKLAAGDVDGARADFTAALQKQPHLEPAIVGEAWLALRSGDVEAARKLIDPRVTDKGDSPAIAIAEAAILRRGDDASKAKAKAILDRLAAGAAGGLTPLAELELARLDRDAGEFGPARKMYASAGQAGNPDARLEGAMMAIDDRDPGGGRETLDTLLKAAGDQPSADLMLETARAHMLIGDHAGAAQLLETAAKLPGVVAWKLARERGRLALRRGDLAAATTALSSALDGCGSDTETILLVADAATETSTALNEKLKKVLTERVDHSPVASIANGKLLLQTGRKDGEAEIAYRAARDTLRAQHAAARLIAQADYGLAVVAYNKAADPIALDEFNSVLNGDPSLYDAYLFKADLLKDKKAAYELAQVAVKYNPDYTRAWSVLGTLAAKNNDQAGLGAAIAKLAVLAPSSPELRDLKRLQR